MTTLCTRSAWWLTAAGLLALACSTGISWAAGENKMPAEGQQAPDISLQATQINKVLPDKKDVKDLDLKDLRGKNVVLYFFPKAMTSGCTVESCGFRDHLDQFTKLDTVVLGISTDTLANQEKFTDKESLNFPLLADPDKKIAEEYGVLQQNGLAKRTTFVIDRKGVIRKVYTKVDTAKHPEEVLSYIKENLTDSK